MASNVVVSHRSSEACNSQICSFRALVSEKPGRKSLGIEAEEGEGEEGVAFTDCPRRSQLWPRSLSTRSADPARGSRTGPCGSCYARNIKPHVSAAGGKETHPPRFSVTLGLRPESWGDVPACP